MDYVWLASAIVSAACMNLAGGLYNRKNADKKVVAPSYNVALIGTVFLFWLVKFLISPSVEWRVLPHSLVFGASFALAFFAQIMAFKTGPVMLTSLFCQLALIFTVVYGFIFWEVEISALVVVGLLLTAVSLVLCLYKGKSGEKSGISVKWLVWATLALVGNAGCAIAQKDQTIAFGGEYGDFFMAVATAFSFVAVVVFFVVSDKSEAKELLKTSWYYPVAGGVFNALQNLAVIVLAASTVIPPEVVYPGLAVGSLALVTVFSLAIFKEKMRWWQWAGVAVGALATVLLSI